MIGLIIFLCPVVFGILAFVVAGTYHLFLPQDVEDDSQWFRRLNAEYRPKPSRRG